MKKNRKKLQQSQVPTKEKPQAPLAPTKEETRAGIKRIALKTLFSSIPVLAASSISPFCAFMVSPVLPCSDMIRQEEEKQTKNCLKYPFSPERTKHYDRIKTAATVGRWARRSVGLLGFITCIACNGPAFENFFINTAAWNAVAPVAQKVGIDMKPLPAVHQLPAENVSGLDH